MYEHFIESVNNSDVTLESAIFKLFLSLTLGGIVGIERKRKGQMAGVRTFALICMGSTLAMIISSYIPIVYNLKVGDPARVAAQVISGVGFLGAGAIIQNKGSIRGLTTAAGIWIVAALGLAIGVGLYLIAIIATAFILFTLVSLERYEHQVMTERSSKTIQVVTKSLKVNTTEMRRTFSHYNIAVHDILLNYNYETQTATITFIVLTKGSTDFESLFSEMRSAYPLVSIQLRNEIN
ncbi:MAG: MgtC/SapB family protein [Bacteroidaceae bacterium]|nr:MgtC/SapB family protein [Bacteroidaceae bacterium]